MLQFLYVAGRAVVFSDDVRIEAGDSGLNIKNHFYV